MPTPPLTNTCQGTNAAAVTSANTVGPNQFDTVTTSGAGNTITFDNTHFQTGTVSIKCLVGATSGTSYCIWKAAISGSPYLTMYSRMYLWIDALPTSNTRLIAFLGNASTLRGSLQLLTTGQLRTVNAAGSTIATSANTVPTGQWVRVEFDVTGDPTVGVLTARLYNTATSNTATETLSSTAQNTGGTIDEVRYGQSSAVTSNTYWMSSLGVTNTGPMGPAFPMAGNAQSSAGLTLPGLAQLAVAATRVWSPFPTYARSSGLRLWPSTGTTVVPVTTGQIWPRGKK